MVGHGLAAATAALLLAGSSFAQATIATSGFKSCDALIAAGLGDHLLFSSTVGDAYNASVESYYSATIRSIKPWCILQPQTAEHVSIAIKALSVLTPAGHWNIAVRGGGHSHWPNNNVAQGVTIDLSLLNQTQVHNSTGYGYNYTGSVASIGAGSRWSSAVLEAEKYGLGLSAGRVGTVGVAGLLLGGGLSFNSGKRGFACDDVVNYEVVLADGTIVNANAEQNPSLFKALKGGGSNFGVVTRFDMATFPAAQLYGGFVLTTWDQKDTVVNSFVRMIDINEANPADSQIVLLQYYSGSESPMVGTIPVSVDGNVNSTSFAPLQGLPTILDARAKQTYGELVTSMSDTGGQRYVWFSLCFKNDKRVIDKASGLFEALIEDVNSNSLLVEEGFTLIFVFQPLPKHYAHINAGGNVLGNDVSLTSNSIVFLGEAFVNSPEAEALLQTKIAAINSKIEAYAQSIEADTQWRYMNYANPSQDPLSSYGAENVAFIKKVAAEYDPTGFFQTRVSGGFKISYVE